jgi:hypothetical protein
MLWRNFTGKSLREVIQSGQFDLVKKEGMGCVKQYGSGIIILNPKDFYRKGGF